MMTKTNFTISHPHTLTGTKTWRRSSKSPFFTYREFCDCREPGSVCGWECKVTPLYYIERHIPQSLCVSDHPKWCQDEPPGLWPQGRDRKWHIDNIMRYPEWRYPGVSWGVFWGVPYSQKIWRGIKFGGLADRPAYCQIKTRQYKPFILDCTHAQCDHTSWAWSSANLKSANIFVDTSFGQSKFNSR